MKDKNYLFNKRLLVHWIETKMATSCSMRETAVRQVQKVSIFSLISYHNPPHPEAIPLSYPFHPTLSLSLTWVSIFFFVLCCHFSLSPHTTFTLPIDRVSVL